MSKTVIGVFNSTSQAEQAVNQLREKGFEKEISIMTKDEKQGGGHRDGNSVMFGADSAAQGATTGGVVGGVLGLAVGAGALAIPGLGPIIAAGPIAGMLSGAATGGIAGGLVDWGIPEDRGRFYEEKVKTGGIVAVIRTDDNKINQAAEVLRANGATDVETH